MPTNPALAFVHAINAADPTALRALMTPAHTFVDAKGNTFTGAAKIIAGWQYFFQTYPGYKITIDHTFSAGSQTALFGSAEGGYRVDGNTLPQRWHVTAAWLAEITDGKISRWTVFCDTAWATPPHPPVS